MGMGTWSMSNFNTTSNQNQNIYPKSCVYNCNTQIYWNTSENAYLEVFQNKSTFAKIDPITLLEIFHNWIIVTILIVHFITKNWIQKLIISNSLEFLSGSISWIQKKCEIQMFLQKIDSDSSFIDLRNKEGFRERFLEIEDFMIKCN